MILNFKYIFLELLDFLGMVGETPIQQDFHVKHYNHWRRYMLKCEEEAYEVNYKRDLHRLMAKEHKPTPFGITKKSWEYEILGDANTYTMETDVWGSDV